MLTGVLSDSDIEIIERVLEQRCVFLAIKPDTRKARKLLVNWSIYFNTE